MRTSANAKHSRTYYVYSSFLVVLAFDMALLAALSRGETLALGLLLPLICYYFFRVTLIVKQERLDCFTPTQLTHYDEEKRLSMDLKNLNDVEVLAFDEWPKGSFCCVYPYVGDSADEEYLTTSKSSWIIYGEFLRWKIFNEPGNIRLKSTPYFRLSLIEGGSFHTGTDLYNLGPYPKSYSSTELKLCANDERLDIRVSVLTELMLIFWTRRFWPDVSILKLLYLFQKFLRYSISKKLILEDSRLVVVESWLFFRRTKDLSTHLESLAMSAPPKDCVTKTKKLHCFLKDQNQLIFLIHDSVSEESVHKFCCRVYWALKTDRDNTLLQALRECCPNSCDDIHRLIAMFLDESFISPLLNL